MRQKQMMKTRKYRKMTKTEITIISNGHNETKMTFKSIREAFDFISSHHWFNKSYKTLQRAATASSTIEIDSTHVLHINRSDWKK